MGTALFADISGFTPLTEALTRVLGAGRGVEELTGHLNRVYDALVSEVHGFRGSIIHFAGDAVTCWFEGDTGGRGIACGLAMQRAMASQPEVRIGSGAPVTLSLKVGIATGNVRRFAVGDPAIQVLDVLAGRTVVEMTETANSARKGELLVADATARVLEKKLEIQEWRAGSSGARSFAVVRGLRDAPEPAPGEAPPPLEDSVVRPWLLPPVFNRLVAGQGEFLTELRPAVALFLRFGGIDYDHDSAAGAKLDGFVRWIQRVVATYEGFLHHVSVGDKGSYLYCAFGAPIAHEDDAVRALTAALELRNPPADLGFDAAPQVGISQGTFRTGAYGATARRTYGVLGDEVNLAARLMEHASRGEVLVSGRSRDAGGDAFVWEPVLPLVIKGKSRPVPVFRLRDRRADDGMELTEPAHATPMVGRAAELRTVLDRLEEARGDGGR